MTAENLAYFLKGFLYGKTELNSSEIQIIREGVRNALSEPVIISTTELNELFQESLRQGWEYQNK